MHIRRQLKGKKEQKTRALQQKDTIIKYNKNPKPNEVHVLFHRSTAPHGVTVPLCATANVCKNLEQFCGHQWSDYVQTKEDDVCSWQIRWSVIRFFWQNTTHKQITARQLCPKHDSDKNITTSRSLRKNCSILTICGMSHKHGDVTKSVHCRPIKCLPHFLRPTRCLQQFLRSTGCLLHFPI